MGDFDLSDLLILRLDWSAGDEVVSSVKGAGAAEFDQLVAALRGDRAAELDRFEAALRAESQRAAELKRFEAALRANGTWFDVWHDPASRDPTGSLTEQALPNPPVAMDLLGLTSAFLVHATTFGPAFVAIVVAWLHGRAGRKVRLKIGDVEAEASNRKEVERLVTLALSYQSKREEDSQDGA